MIERLAAADLSAGKAAVERTLSELSGDPGTSEIKAYRSDIDRLFAGGTVEAIIEALRADGGDWARQQADILDTRSPTSMKITLEQLRRGSELDLDAVLQMEYRMSQACMEGHDFHEGIRAVLVDKDHKPQWKPATLEEVDEALVERHFAPLGERELRF